jgi:chromate transporter
MPGPLAAQVAMWVGYLRRGPLGAAAVAAAFVAPSFLMVVVVGAIYARYSGLAIVQSLFYGIAPAVMAIITIAAVKLVRMTDGHDWRLWIISGLIFALTAITGSEPILVIIGAGLLMILLDARPALRRRRSCATESSPSTTGLPTDNSSTPSPWVSSPRDRSSSPPGSSATSWPGYPVRSWPPSPFSLRSTSV